MKLTPQEKTQLREIITSAGKLMLSLAKSNFILKYKKADDYCTDADLKVENYITKALNKNFPNYNLLAEEKGLQDRKSKYTFVLDPIDGTKNYFRSIPFTAISLALKYKDKVISGQVYNPFTDEYFEAFEGNKPSFNSKSFYLKENFAFENAVIALEMPSQSLNVNLYNKFDQKILKLKNKISWVRVLGSAAMELCYTARGSLDAYVDFSGSTKEWDIAAGRFILEQAGGVYKEWEDGVMVGGRLEVVKKIGEWLCN